MGNRRHRFGRDGRWMSFAAAALAVTAFAVAPAGVDAATTTFGSSLGAPATLDTVSNLAYQEQHSAIDTSLWNVASSGVTSGAPSSGQLLKVELEGCAVPSPEGPAPLTQIHFQSLVPVGAGATVKSTSQPFDVPVCGVGGASGGTISTYTPTNFCIAQGEYVDFSDEGGYVPGSYPAGVAYRVMASAQGAILDSFVGAAGNGAELSPTNTSPVGGFAANRDAEVLLRATLGTESDATACGGTAGKGPASSGAPPPVAGPNVGVKAQTDGINSHSVVSVSFFCHAKPQCQGTATLSIPGGTTVRRRIRGTHRFHRVSIAGTYGTATFAIATGKTAHVPVHVGATLVKLARRPGGVSVVLTVLDGGQPASQKITVKV